MVSVFLIAWSIKCGSGNQQLLVMAALCNRGPLYFCPVVSIFYLSFFSSPNLSSRRCLPYFHTWCGLSANLECMSEMCGTRLAANTGHKKSPFWHHRTTLSGCIFAAKAYIDNWKKNLLNIDTSSTCPHNMVNFSYLDLLASLGHPCKFQRVSRLGIVTARH